MARPAFRIARAAGLRGRVYRSRHPHPEHSPAPVFVLLHGIGMSHRSLNRLQRALGKVGTAYSFDLPGFGATPKPSHALSVSSYAMYVERVLDRLGIVSCVLVGHSMGAQFAVELAVRRPAMVSRLVLIGPVVDPRRRTLAQQALAICGDCLREPLSANAIALTDYLRCGFRWYLAELPEMMAYPTEERIAEVSAPVLVVRGVDDPVAGSDWCHALVAAAGFARLLEVPGQRHAVQQGAPALVASSIAAFASHAEPGST